MCPSTGAKDSPALGLVMGRGQPGLGWSELCAGLGGTRAQGPPAMPYPGIREELGWWEHLLACPVGGTKSKAG